jgi:hypothetical protein
MLVEKEADKMIDIMKRKANPVGTPPIALPLTLKSFISPHRY